MFPTMRWMVFAAIVAIAASIESGCNGPSVYPVKGKVVYSDGQPLREGRVVVDSGESPIGSWGLIREDGTFDLGTHTPNDGIPAGTWKVKIENAITHPPSGYQGNTPFVSKPLIDPKFFDFETSELVFEVPAQQEWNITVTKP